ncbi:MAG: C10 family peptidase, partial [Eubacteriales bacterium]
GGKSGGVCGSGSASAAGLRAVAGVVTTPGETVDFLLDASAPDGIRNYWINVLTLTGYGGPAVLHYGEGEKNRPRSFFPFFSFSNIVGIDKAALVAKNLSWVYHTGTVDFASIKPVLLSSRFEEGRAIYYIFGYSGQQGFAIVSAADNVLPILGYSFEGNYALKEEEMPPQMVSMFDFYARQISEAIINSMPPDQQINEQWEYFLKTVPNPEANPATIVGPLTATTWDQNCYYNELCPATGGTHPAGPCSHVYTGCVATAMAQIMKYHNYPPQGTGTLSYSEPGNSATASASADPSYGTLSVNLGYEYDWNNMPNSISASNTDIAALMKHCGYSVSMDYSYAGSSSYTSDVPSALVNNFYYSSTAA